MSTATYFRRGEGKSVNAQIAESEGRKTASGWASHLGRRISASDIKEALGQREWHHTGKYASETFYYDRHEIDDGMKAIIAARDARLAQAKEIAVRIGHATVKWTEWIGIKRPTKVQKSYTGEVELRGDWVSFDGRKKRTTANSFVGIEWTAEQVSA